ncbi:MAG: GrdX family protein [Caloramator sp.]|nr:GrdX family protein [Caloramator sp.]
MKENALIITNNDLVSKILNSGKYKIIFVNGTLMDVLIKVRDYIHKGHKLLTHPLMGSVKPNETPYKTVLISEKNYEYVDIQSLMYIENSIEVSQNLIRNRQPRNWPDKVLEDFKIIDFDLINNAINN